MLFGTRDVSKSFRAPGVIDCHKRVRLARNSFIAALAPLRNDKAKLRVIGGRKATGPKIWIAGLPNRKLRPDSSWVRDGGSPVFFRQGPLSRVDIARGVSERPPSRATGFGRGRLPMGEISSFHCLFAEGNCPGGEKPAHWGAGRDCLLGLG